MKKLSNAYKPVHPLVEKLFSLPGRNSTTFDAFQRLDDRLGHPHRAFRTIHVGGTNGKGSVATKIAASLTAEGYRVGLYTSPHIFDYRERIQINGEIIPDPIPHLQHLFTSMTEELSFFDLLTALAFLHFRQEKVDWAVIEVGLGGKYDATNVIRPEVAAITSVGWDHVEILGDTLEKIARNKGGIAKPGVPLVVGSSAAPFFPHAHTVPRITPYDLENQAIAAKVLSHIGISHPKALFAKPPCRLEIQGDLILDVAHNPEGFTRLLEALAHHFPNQKFHFALAFSHTKDWRACIDLLRPHALSLTALRGTHPKLLPPEALGLPVAETLPSVRPLVLCGSFYIMNERPKEETEPSDD